MHTTALPARERAQILATDVTLTRGTHLLLQHVNVSVTPRSRIAIVGENGRGKTTLLHTLAGTLLPDSGTVHRTGTIAVAEQDMPITDGQTVGDAVADTIAPSQHALAELDIAATQLSESDDAAQRYADALDRAERLDAWDAERRVHVALAELGATTEMHTPLTRLSVGQRYRVRLACILGGTDDFLLLDEPTNHLDAHGIIFMLERLKTRRGGVVFVSHDRALISSLAESIIDLDPTPDGRPRTYGNGYEGYRQGRAAELERWKRDYTSQRREATRLTQDLAEAQNRLVSKWRPEKGSPKHGRATRAGGLVQSVHRRQEALDAHRVTVPPPPQEFGFPELTAPTGTPLVRLHEAMIPGRMPEPVTWELKGGDKFVITGENGAGKSTLLNMLAGEQPPEIGARTSATRTRIGYLRQETRLPVNEPAYDVYAARVQQLVTRGLLGRSHTLGLSALGLLQPGEQHKRVGELSTGQQRRLDLALVLAARPNLLLLDEPTNHLSIALIDEFTLALLTTGATVVIATHDTTLLNDLHSWPRRELSNL